MRQYAIKRIALFVPTVLLLTIIVFVLMSIIPGDPALAILNEGEGNYTQRDLDRLRHELGTDRSIPVQYVDWISHAVVGDFGDSFWFHAPVMTELQKRIPRTLELAVLAIVLAIVFSVPLGVLSAVRPDGWLDYFARFFSLVGVSIPNFLFAILLMLFLVSMFGWLPPLGYADLWVDPLTNLKQMAFPALSLALYDMAFIARVTRSSMMEILREDYMRTARAKGLSEKTVLIRHGLKNAALPILTMTGWQFGRLF
jgi:peptide/nickel transport system permease protein